MQYTHEKLVQCSIITTRRNSANSTHFGRPAPQYRRVRAGRNNLYFAPNSRANPRARHALAQGVCPAGLAQGFDVAGASKFALCRAQTRVLSVHLAEVKYHALGPAAAFSKKLVDVDTDHMDALALDPRAQRRGDRRRRIEIAPLCGFNIKRVPDEVDGVRIAHLDQAI